MKKILIAILALVMLASLAACGGETSNDTDAADTGDAALADLDIFGNGYKVVYDVTDSATITAMTAMIEKINTSSGTKLSSMNVGNPEIEYEIQFGLKTGRSDAENVYNEIAAYADEDTAAYAIRAIGNKVIIAASGKDALKVAADRFASMASANFTVSNDFDETAVFDIAGYQSGELELIYADEFLSDCTLSAIYIDGKPISGISPDKTEYAVATEGRTVNQSTVTAKSKLPGAKVDVLVSADTDISSTYDYKIEVSITSADGQNKEDYTLNMVETEALDSFNLDTWLKPYWEGGIVYHESIMFVGNDGAPLMYTPECVLSVRSSDLKTEYVEGVDYEVKDGKIYRLEGSAIPVFTWEDFYPTSKETSVTGNAFKGSSKPWVMFAEGTYFHQRQVFVTYKHSEQESSASNPYFIPEVSTKLHKFIEKLERGEEVNIVFYGDSITAGANASGREGAAPNTPMWPQMVTYALQAKYPNAKINYVNTAVGGKETNWGIESLMGRVIVKSPDIVILGFGMNDGQKTTEQYIANIKTIVDGILGYTPSCEIAMIGTMLPHSESSYYTGQYLQEAALKELAKNYDNVDVIPMTSVHTSILTQKRYFDMTGNNVNHPNDFLIRIYAQTVLKVLVG